MDQDPAARFGVGAGELAAEAVGVAGREESDAHGFGGSVGGVVADGVAGGYVLQAEDAGLPGEDGLERGLELGLGVCVRVRVVDGETVAIEGDAGAHQRFCVDGGGQSCEPVESFIWGLAVAVVECGGVAGVEPLGWKPTPVMAVRASSKR